MMKQRLKRLFLLDGFGAFLTAVLLCAVLIPLEKHFGMPRKVLHVLSAIAFGYAVYSICCSFFAYRNLRCLLRIIAIANCAYCLLTAILTILYYEQLTGLGITYFIMEISVITSLVVMEWKAS